MFLCLLLVLVAINGVLAAGQSVSALLLFTVHAAVLYAPESNLERSEIETLRTAKVYVDVAMYSFTDRELTEELVRLARSRVRIRVYRDSREYLQENQRGSSGRSNGQ
jgi:phosphatidylserine/phosphatidylglycerophosphate/cardiolipin synthase-like enzyme